MIDKARHGELLLQHRFTMTLVLLFIPYIAFGFSLLRPKAWAPVVALLLSAWTFQNSFQQHLPGWFRTASIHTRFGPATDFIADYTMGEMVAVPRLNERWPDELLAKLNALHPDEGVGLLVLDFFGWQETYNVAFRADIRATSIVFLPEAQTDASAGRHHMEDYLNRLKDPPGILVVKEDLPEDVVYNVTKGLFENLDEIRQAHYKANDTTLERAIEAITVPFHPGAIKYYKEAGIWKE